MRPSKSDHNLFYIQSDSIDGNEIIIRGPELRHIRSVLRKKKGEHLFLIDGNGYQYEAEITASASSAVTVMVVKKEFMPRRSKVDITLGFVPVKGTRNDTVIEKCTELGVSRFVIFPSARAVVRDIGRNKAGRLAKIAQSAMTQSRQFHLPGIESVATFDELFKKAAQYDHRYVADPAGQVAIPATGRSVLVLVGPEGGFTDQEMDSFDAHGVKRLALGPTRLRSETAAMVAVTKILVEYKQL